MSDVIEALFYDRYSVHDPGPASREYAACSAALEPYYIKIRETLGKDFFDGMDRAAMDLMSMENMSFFRKGLQLGGQMALAIFADTLPPDP